jgi:hypothetical protein
MGKIRDYIKKKIELKLFNLVRQDYLERFVGNLGKIVEEDDKIVIYATQKLVDKNGKKIIYELHSSGMNTYYEKSREIVEKYKLNKPVYFVFDGIKFDRYVQLSSHFSNVIFKNCTFDNGLQVFHCENLTLENNKYYNWIDFGYKPFLSGKVKELTIKNDKFVNSYENKKYSETKFGIQISSDKVNIVNSNICAESHGKINIDAKEISIINSTISAPEIYLGSDSIKSSNSVIKSNNGIIIDNKNCDFNGNVQAPIVIYNGIDLNASNKTISVNESDVNLKKARQKLLNKLRYLRDYCEQININKSQKIKKQLDSQPISKVLR